MDDPPHVLVAGEASGEVLRLDEPLSLWGGVDAATGVIIDRRHPQVGESISGRVLAMPHGRGSSSASSVLVETIRCGTNPVAIVMLEPDAILALGAMVADEVYGRSLPVVAVGERMFASLQTGDFVAVGPDGSVLQVDVGRDGHRTGGHRRGVET